MNIAERLQVVIKMSGLSNTAFADKIGVQRSSISHVTSGRNKPSLEFIQKILSAFPRVDADWLISGKKVGRSTTNIQGGNRIEEKEASESDLAEKEKENYSVKFHETNRYWEAKAKEIEKIIVFYKDGTFVETYPSLSFKVTKGEPDVKNE